MQCSPAIRSAQAQVDPHWFPWTHRLLEHLADTAEDWENDECSPLFAPALSICGVALVVLVLRPR